jgi:hypothetical protein
MLGGSDEDEDDDEESLLEEGQVSPLQNWLFTPELQWQFRGKWALQGGAGAGGFERS